MTSTEPPSAPAGTMLAGKLRVNRVIGRGAMGIVYDATDVLLARRVAVKVMAPELVTDSGQRRRFEREARAAATLKSEHAVRIHEVGEADGAPFLVMEYLEGSTLDTIVDAHGTLPIGVAVGWILEALDALAEAHTRGLVHRDIKPGNLFLADRAGRTPTVKVLDFGLVKNVDPSLTQLTSMGTLMGTPAYMAPEQIRAAPDVDARADVWSIGATLYELLSGSLPFPAPSIPDMIRNILEGEPRPLRALRPGIPDTLEAVIRRCMARDPAARFASASEVAQALEAAMTLGTAETVRLDAPVGDAAAPTARRAAARRPSRARTGLGLFLASTAGVLAVGSVAAFIVLHRPPRPIETRPQEEEGGSAITIVSPPAAIASSVASVASVAPADAGSPARLPRRAAPAHHAQITHVRGFDRARVLAWFKPLQSEVDTVCMTSVPCLDVSIQFDKHGPPTLFPIGPQRATPGCVESGAIVYQCTANILQRQPPTSLCVEDAALCHGSIVFTYR